MKKVKMCIVRARPKQILLIHAIALFSFSCADSGLSPEERDFNMIFKYGVRARNEINTFQNTYTKDLILDGTITVPFSLSDDELCKIREKMVEIDFFSYPDTFVVRSSSGVAVSIDPYPTFFFRVRLNSADKVLFWERGYIGDDQRAMELQDLIRFVVPIIESKPEYQRLPPARGGYL